MMTPGIVPSETRAPKEKEDERRKIIIALLFLLLGFSCIFCSSQSALWLIDRKQIDASMLASRQADYGSGPGIALAPLSGDIAAEANRDEEQLLLRQTPIAGGLGVVILPNPIPTPAPTLVVLLPTPTPTPTPTVSTPSEPPTAPPTAIVIAPTSTSLPPTLPSPTLPLPTLPLPTLPPPTSPLPASPPPTSPPPTSPPPTSPPPTSPPTSSPPTATATPTATPTATATPIPPTVFFAAPSFSIDESGGVASIAVNLSAVSTLPITVNYTITAGTATAGSDYMATNGTLSFSPGVPSQTFPVTILDDTLDELDETVNLTLSAPVNATLGVPNPATLIIVDNDTPPTVQFSAPNYTVSESDGTAPITVTLSTASELTVTVVYTTGNNTAIAGSDYIPAGGTLTFPPLQTVQTFTVAIINDSGQEPAEAVNLTLINPVNATIAGANPATLTIVDDDIAATPCSSSNPSSVVDIGPPDCKWTTFGGGTIITDVTATGGPPIIVDGNSDFDLVYYEREADPGSTGYIDLDKVKIEISADNINWYTVFDWGDGILDVNTNIGQAGYGAGGNEPDNAQIPMSDPPLYRSSSGPITGIAIDVDAFAPIAPPPYYRYVRLTGGGGAEVDSIEVLP